MGLNYLLTSRQTHSAKNDIDITEMVFSKLWKLASEKENTNLSIEELEEFSKRPLILDQWPFGKHRNKPIDQVLKTDRQYVNWFLYKAESSFRKGYPDLVYTLKEKLNA